MEKKIIRLNEAGQSDGLVTLVKDLKEEQITEMLRKYAALGKMEGASLLRGIFRGCTSQEQKSVPFRVTFKLLRDDVPKDRLAIEMTGILLMEADFQSCSCLIEVVNIFTESMKGNEDIGPRVYDVFPKVLSTLASKQSISYENNHMTGSQFKSHVLNSLCSGRWESHTAVHLTEMFHKDIKMSEEEVTFVVDKVLRMLGKVDLQQLPALIYQLMLLDSKGPKRKALQGICLFLSELDEKHKEREDKEDDCDIVSDELPETLNMTEATIITHVTFAMKVKQERAKEFLQFLKAGQQGNPGMIFSPFVIALSISVAQIPRFEEPIMEVLKTTIYRNFKDVERSHTCGWMSEFVPEPCDVTSALCETAKRDFSTTGLEQVSHGLVQLAFSLMESYGPKSAPFGKGPGKPLPLKGANRKTCDLAIKILQHLFKGSESLQVDILEQTVNSFLTNMSGVCTHYVDLFQALVQTSPFAILSCLNKLREMLDYLSRLSPYTAKGILQALQPLMKLNVSLKDSLMLLLRKAMFARQLESRKIAVLGYLQILKHFQVFGSLPLSQPCSQGMMGAFSAQVTSVDVHSTQKQPANYEALVCAEILSNLRRCLTQQSEVRRTMYQGLYGVVCHNSKLLGPVLKLLLSQLQIYVDADEDAQPPIKLEPTIVTQGEKVVLVEPMSTMLQSLIQCTMKAKKTLKARAADIIDDVDEEEEDDETLEEVLERVTKMLNSLKKRLLDSEMEDFQLDKSADFSATTTVGAKNTLLATQLMDVYDSLMEYTLTEDVLSTESADEIQKLFSHRSQVHSTMSEKVNQGNSSKTSKQSKKSAPSHLSLHCLSHALNSLFGDPLINQEAALKLKDNVDLCHFLVSVSLDKLREMKDGVHLMDTLVGSKEKVFQALCVFARVFLDQVNTSLYARTQPSGKQKAVTALSLEGLDVTITIVCEQFKPQLRDFLQELEPSVTDQNDEVSVQDSVHMLMKKLQRMLIDVLTSDPDGRFISLKDAVSFCNIFDTLSKELDKESEQLTQVQTWTTKVCTDHAVDEPILAKKLFSLHWDFTRKMKSGASLMRSVAQDLHSQIGDIDQEVEVENRTHFALVNAKTSHQCILTLLSWSDQLVDEVMWLLNQKISKIGNNSHFISEKLSEDDEEGRDNFEKVVCMQLGLLVNSFHELVQTATPPGPPMNNTIKSLVKIYDALTLFSKYYIALYTSQTGQLSGRYEKLVKLSGCQLTQFVYPFITYVQTTQSEKLSSIPKQKSKKKGKAKTSGTDDGDAFQIMKGKAGMVMRESKLVTNLIYSIEQYERFILRLSKKSKINLLQDFRLSTCRDFRISNAAVEAALNNSSESEESSDGEKENEDNDQPKAKKRKKGK